jgi:hypothetical protein
MATLADVSKQGKSTPLPQPLTIRYKGIWDMQDFYESVISYLRERKWHFHEKVYKHKHPSPFGVERQYVWLATQQVDDWMHVDINIYIHTYDAHEIEVIKNGEKKILTEGKIWISMKTWMISDYPEQWNTDSFWLQLKDFYLKYVIRRKVMEGYSPRYRHEISAFYHFMLGKLKADTRDYQYLTLAGVHRRGP